MFPQNSYNPYNKLDKQRTPRTTGRVYGQQHHALAPPPSDVLPFSATASAPITGPQYVADPSAPITKADLMAITAPISEMRQEIRDLSMKVNEFEANLFSRLSDRLDQQLVQSVHSAVQPIESRLNSHDAQLQECLDYQRRQQIDQCKTTVLIQNFEGDITPAEASELFRLDQFPNSIASITKSRTTGYPTVKIKFPDVRTRQAFFSGFKAHPPMHKSRTLRIKLDDPPFIRQMKDSLFKAKDDLKRQFPNKEFLIDFKAKTINSDGICYARMEASGFVRRVL